MTIPINQSQIAHTTTEWTSLNPTLTLNTIGIEVMSNGYNRYKRGDGVTAWLSLAYIDKVYNGAEIVVDAVPTDGSGNPVASNGVYDALAGKQNKITNTANGVFYGSGAAGTLNQTAQPSVGSVLWQGSSGAPYWAALADVITAAKASIVNTIYPVGSIYTSVNSTSPATLFGGSWTQIKGRFLLATGGNDANTTTYWGSLAENAFNCPAGELGGEAWHPLTTAEMPSHKHTAGTDNDKRAFGGNSTTSGPAAGNGYATLLSAINTSPTGGGGSHNNMPPYLVVYMWKRTA